MHFVGGCAGSVKEEVQRELNVQETVTNVGQGQRLAGEKGVNSRVYGYVWSSVNQEERVFVSVESRNVCESGLGPHRQASPKHSMHFISS